MPTIKRRSTKRKTSTKKSGMSARNKLILKALLGVSGAGALAAGGYGLSKRYGVTAGLKGYPSIYKKTGGKRRSIRRMMW
jgi:hypothetical protein